jgi:hypothetical protein
MTDRVVLTNKKTGQKLPEATMRSHDYGWVEIRFDGAAFCGNFAVSDWDIEYVKPPLPTEPGWYSLRGGNVAFLSVSGNWYEHSSVTVWKRDPEYIARYITGRMVEVPFDE